MNMIELAERKPFTVSLEGAEKVSLTLISERELMLYFLDAVSINISEFSENIYSKYISHKLPLARDNSGHIWQVPLDDDARKLYTYELSPSDIVWQARRWTSDDVMRDPDGFWDTFSGLKKLEDKCAEIEKNRKKARSSPKKAVSISHEYSGR